MGHSDYLEAARKVEKLKTQNSILKETLVQIINQKEVEPASKRLAKEALIRVEETYVK